MCHFCLQYAASHNQTHVPTHPDVVENDNERPVWSIEEIIDQLDIHKLSIRGDVIKYAFPENADFFAAAPSGEAEGHSQLSDYQQAHARIVYSHFDDLVARKVVETSDPFSANITMSNTTTDIIYAHAGVGGGAVWLNTASGLLQTPKIGDWGFLTYLHEVGHSFGLTHSKVHAHDSHMYTVMTTRWATETGADITGADGKSYFPKTLMLHDILTLHKKYGADMTTRAGDTVYGFNSNTNSPIYDFEQNANPFLSIWDGGGIDTLDLSGFAPDEGNLGSVINLAPGSFSDTASMTKNISIAYGAWIENAIGGRGNDTITGNELDNRLIGNAGDDVIDGLAGNDFIDGGEGRDTLIGGAGNDTIVWDENDDLAGLDGGSGHDVLRVNNGSVPTHFDLAGHGFEAAQHVRPGDPGEFWVTKTTHYNATWQKLRETGVDDFGQSYKTVFDADGTKPFTSYTNQFNTEGQRLQQTGERDNGQTWLYTFDVNDTGTWSRINTTYDTSNIAWWNTSSRHINDAGQTYLITGTKDDGGTWQHIYDVDNAEGWSRYSFHFDAQGRLTKTGGEFDHGESWNQISDADNTRAWSQVTNYFTEDGRKYHQSGEMDNGLAWTHSWDVNNTEAWSRATFREDRADTAWWSEQTLYYNDANQLLRIAGVKDDTDEWEHTWDVAGTEVWDRQTVYRDVVDSRDWFERIQTFDENGTLLSTSYVDDIV